ncbi:helix-turn-helix domain-containing protein [Ochrovirga pacifica]|uniref:helix-turn-helix domain-containing protein n=1 Tax=Ochrovirga pacifica TaxID=1042376 RepID=UPI00049688EC|nr:helix-turn-helix domain-containing protein [Ochrovirga pacifica]
MNIKSVSFEQDSKELILLERILMSNNCYLYFFEKDTIELEGEKIKTTSIYVQPILSRALKYKVLKPCKIYGVRLPIDGVYRMHITPKNQVVDLANYYPKEVLEILKHACQQKKFEALQTFINHFEYKDSSFLGAVKYIVNTQKTEVKVKELASYLNCSTRYIEKEFKKKIGITPKQYLRNKKFIEALAFYKPELHWKDIGYYHYRHFLRDWKQVMELPFDETSLNSYAHQARLIVSTRSRNNKKRVKATNK